MIKCNFKVNMFGDNPPNRRLTPKEYEEEIAESKIWKHRPRQYLYDIPFYDFLPPAPKIPFVNFDLGWKK